LIELDRAAHHAAVLAEEAFPGGEGEHHLAIGVGAVFFGLEDAAERGAGAEDVEPAVGDAGAVETLGNAGAGVIEIAGIDERGGFELLGAVQHVGEIGDGDSDIAQRQLVVFHADGDHACGVGNTHGVEQHLVDDTEDGGVGADSQRQGQEGDDGVGGSFQQCTDSVAHTNEYAACGGW
jgi:hypothetical protein